MGLPPFRHEPFVAKLEAAQAEGRADFVPAHLSRLEALIAECINWQTAVAELEYRARRGRHCEEGTW